MAPVAADRGTQQTLSRPVLVEGQGLHSGVVVKVALKPAAPDTGVRFQRVDLEGAPWVIAAPESMASGARCTTLASGSARVRTVEHLMAAVMALGIDNLIVEMDAEEAPILDGSAMPWVEVLDGAGCAAQDRPRRVLSLASPVLWSQGETVMMALPHPVLRLTVASTTSHPVAGNQVVDLVVDAPSFRARLAPSRTFCYEEEVEALLAAGLARGGSLDNALVVKQDGYSSALRVDQELAAHKALDLLGDLGVLGQGLALHVVAVRPSHRANQELVAVIARQLRSGRSDQSSPTEFMVDQRSVAGACAPSSVEI